MNAVGTKTIETERLILRKMQKKDAELIYKNWTSDKNVSKYVTWDTHKSVKDTKKYVHHAHMRYADEPYAGRGARYLFKQPENIRTYLREDK